MSNPPNRFILFVRNLLTNRMIKLIPVFLFVISLALISSCKQKSPILLIIKNDFKGDLVIIENSENYDMPVPQALENFGNYDYEVGDDDTLIVNDLLTDTTLYNMSYANMTSIPDENVTYKFIGKQKLIITIK